MYGNQPRNVEFARTDSLMQRNLATNFARMVVLKSPQGTKFHTYSQDVHDA
jgi:hypothetical protein